MKSLKLQVLASSEPEPQIVQIELRDMIIAGWTGRDQSAVLRHIAELEKIGVKRPKRTPVFYRVAASLLTTETHVDVVGSESTGEIEFVLIQGREDLLIGLGSDHTDRKAETLGVTLSKQMCPKPIATETWRWEDIAVHWDQLQLRCVAHTSAGAVLYQEGSVTAMLHPLDLMARYTLFGGSFLPGSAMFCGTLAARNEIKWANNYQLELIDPVLQRKIQHSYSVRPLPVAEEC
jgi:Protein of unknown function (DUF2848)